MSASVWEIMLPAFAECLVLTGLHAYLGLHVLRRKVIFVDLTLAQIAALGTTVGVLFGLSSASPGAYVLSLAFTFAGAALFAVTRARSSRVPQEAVIGLAYAVAAALAILLVAQAPNGAKQVKDIMTGRLLWVGWDTVAVTAAVYAALGAVHFALRRPFLLISEDPEEAFRRGLRVRLWDFLFYVSFGVAISLSVRTAGVLLVFVFLVVPAIVALSFARTLRGQLLVGWTFGTLTTAAGQALSYAADLSSGPTVVALYGVLLVPVGLFGFVRAAADRRRALATIGLGLGAAAAVALLFFAAGRAMSGTALARAGDEHDHEHAHAAGEEPGHAAEPTKQAAPGAELLARLEQAGFEGQGEVLAAAGSIEELDAAFALAEEPALKVALARRLGELQPVRGAARLLSVLEPEAAPFEKEEAASALEALLGERLGFDPEASPEANAEALARVRAFVERGRATAAALSE
ncbi:MAG: metal ABC transporter permease [Myxococcales bacterium]|jgi:zinc/manganese transport system permease protein